MRTRTFVASIVLAAAVSATVSSLTTIMVMSDTPTTTASQPVTVPVESGVTESSPVMTATPFQGVVAVNEAGQATCAQGGVSLPLNGEVKGFVDKWTVTPYTGFTRVEGDLLGAAAVIVNDNQWGVVNETTTAFLLNTRTWGPLKSLTVCGGGR